MQQHVLHLKSGMADMPPDHETMKMWTINSVYSMSNIGPETGDNFMYVVCPFG